MDEVNNILNSQIQNLIDINNRITLENASLKKQNDLLFFSNTEQTEKNNNLQFDYDKIIENQKKNFEYAKKILKKNNISNNNMDNENNKDDEDKLMKILKIIERQFDFKKHNITDETKNANLISDINYENVLISNHEKFNVDLILNLYNISNRKNEKLIYYVEKYIEIIDKCFKYYQK